MNQMPEAKYDTRIPECLKVISNPTRLDIFLKILDRSCDCHIDAGDGVGGNCVTQIGVELEIPQPTVSNHVKELINSGLVRSERRGRKVFLFVNADIVGIIEEFFKRTSEEARTSESTCNL